MVDCPDCMKKMTQVGVTPDQQNYEGIKDIWRCSNCKVEIIYYLNDAW